MTQSKDWTASSTKTTATKIVSGLGMIQTTTFTCTLSMFSHYSKHVYTELSQLVNYHHRIFKNISRNQVVNPLCTSSWILVSLFSLFLDRWCSVPDINHNLNMKIFGLACMVDISLHKELSILGCWTQRWDNIVNCNILFGLIDHFGLLKDIL